MFAIEDRVSPSSSSVAARNDSCSSRYQQPPQSDLQLSVVPVPSPGVSAIYQHVASPYTPLTLPLPSPSPPPVYIACSLPLAAPLAHLHPYAFVSGFWWCNSLTTGYTYDLNQVFTATRSCTLHAARLIPHFSARRSARAFPSPSI